MANILLTTYCNRNCSYCFAQGKVDLDKDKGDPSKNMSIEALEKIIAFYKKSMLRRFVILGGEPTLHPEFPILLERVCQEPFFKSILIFTNGVIPQKALTWLSKSKDPRLTLALNLNAPADYSAAQWGRINRTMEALGSKIGLGINIYEPGQDYSYLLDAINTYRLVPHIRLGLTHPIAHAQNRYARREDFPAIAADIVAFAETASQRKISFSFDCGFEFCMFSLRQHTELLRFGIKFKSLCDPIVDIGPDLDVWRCFPLLNDSAGKLHAFSSRLEIIDYFEKKYKSIKLTGNLIDCPDCRYRINGLCCAGCLARNIISFAQGNANAH